MRGVTLVVVLLAALAVAHPEHFARLRAAHADVLGPNHPDRLVSPLPLYGPLLSANYAGYLQLAAGQRVFYWFVESQGNPATDPIVLWMNGGPGCSSIWGMHAENGPYQMRHGGKWVENDFAWTKHANMFYFDSPPGVGYSVDVNPPLLWGDNTTATANYESLQLFFARFPEFAAHRFHIAGESYGGHYVPQLADKILEGSSDQIRANFKGFMVGNPCTGAFECGNNDPTLIEYLKTHGLMSLNDSALTGSGVYNPYDILVPTCAARVDSDMARWKNPVLDAFRKKYLDAETGSVDTPAPYGPCHSTYIHEWMNTPAVQKAIHADQNVTWAGCSSTLNYNVTEVPLPVVHLYQKFFQRTNWSIMFYSGTADTVVNFIATQTVLWSMNRPLINPVFQPWYYPYVYNTSLTQLGGFFLQWDKVSWMGVRDAGHEVAMFNPPAGAQVFANYLQYGGPAPLP